MRIPGRLFVIEGLDGSGKTIQAGQLIIRLQQEFPNRAIRSEDFPRYDHPSSYGIRKYLKKDGFTKGYREELSSSPYGPSLLYAIDRMDATHSLEDGGNIADFLAAGGIIVSNRYTQSSDGFQASKIEDPEERAKFVIWLYHLEYDLLKIPRPNLVIFLDLPPRLARESKLAQLASQNKKPDSHEADLDVFHRAQQVYRETAARNPQDWVVIDMMIPDGSRRKTPEEVQEEVFATVLQHM